MPLEKEQYWNEINIQKEVKISSEIINSPEWNIIYEKNKIELEKLKNLTWIKEVYLEDLKNTPLFMDWIKRYNWEMLWYGQKDLILKNYNNVDAKKTNLEDLEKIKFPLIYDELKNVFPNNLEDLKIEHKIKWKDLIFITKLENNLHALSYYKDWKLYLATYISPWAKWHETPEWEFKIEFKEIDKRSKKYDDAPMAYAMNINWWIFMHQWNSNWTMKSHWCIRVPGLYEQELFYVVKNKTPVIIDFNTNKNSWK